MRKEGVGYSRRVYGIDDGVNAGKLRIVRAGAHLTNILNNNLSIIITCFIFTFTNS